MNHSISNNENQQIYKLILKLNSRTVNIIKYNNNNTYINTSTTNSNNDIKGIHWWCSRGLCK